MIQRYDLIQGQIADRREGSFVRYADIEPLLPKWVATSERNPNRAGHYMLLLTDGTISEDFWFADDLQCWDDYLPREVNCWLEMVLPPLPEPT